MLRNLSKAEECLKKIHIPEVNPNTILPSIYLELGKIEDGRRLLQNNLLRCFGEMYISCSLLGSTYSGEVETVNEDIDFEKAEKYINLSMKTKEILYPEGKNILPVDTNYILLAKLYMKKNKQEKAIDLLNNMVKEIKDFDRNKTYNANKIWCFDYLLGKEQICSDDIMKKTYENIVQTLELEFKDLNLNKEYENLLQELRNII
ncbi:MAG: hypothetical protein RSD77_07025 [Romboutsia sp.]